MLNVNTLSKEQFGEISFPKHIYDALILGKREGQINFDWFERIFIEDMEEFSRARRGQALQERLNKVREFVQAGEKHKIALRGDFKENAKRHRKDLSARRDFAADLIFDFMRTAYAGLAMNRHDNPFDEIHRIKREDKDAYRAMLLSSIMLNAAVHYTFAKIKESPEYGGLLDWDKRQSKYPVLESKKMINDSDLEKNDAAKEIEMFLDIRRYYDHLDTDVENMNYAKMIQQDILKPGEQKSEILTAIQKMHLPLDALERLYARKEEPEDLPPLAPPKEEPPPMAAFG